MTNSDKFKQVFGLYATELWAMTETEFLAWLNADAEPERKTGHWVGARQYCRHLEEVTGEKYSPSGNMIYCDQCWQASDRKSNYCPDCGSYNGGGA